VALRVISCEGYKAFSQPTALELGAITVIFGKNNSGKTTLARLPIFLAASLSDPSFYALKSTGVNFGSSFNDLASAEQVHSRVTMSLTWDESSIQVTLQRVSSPEGEDRVVLINLIVDDETAVQRDIAEAFGAESNASSILEELSAVQESSLQGHQDDLRRVSASILHIPSARPKIEAVYLLRDPSSWTVEEFPYIMAADRSLVETTARWMAETLHVQSLAVDYAGFAFRLAARERMTAINLANAGRGSQSALPVAGILSGVADERVKPALVIVEEPEVHLHPSAHGALADLAIRAAARTQILVETHSENFILRLRRRISEGSLNPEELRLYYVDEHHQVNAITVNKFGSAEDWPRGVFESDVEEAEAIVRAKLAAMNVDR
jgi:predicted ATPase